MTDKNIKSKITLTIVLLTTLVLAAVYSTYTHLSAREDSELQQLKLSTTREKTILMSAMMTGGIRWSKTASIANVHATYADSEIGADLTDVLAIDAKENELYSSHSEDEKKIDLNELLKTHRSSIDSSTFYSLDTETHMVTMVAVFDKKRNIAGYVAMAWVK